MSLARLVMLGRPQLRVCYDTQERMLPVMNLLRNMRLGVAKYLHGRTPCQLTWDESTQDIARPIAKIIVAKLDAIDGIKSDPHTSDD